MKTIKSQKKMKILGLLIVLCAFLYLTIDIDFTNPMLVRYAMKLRIPKLIVMSIVAITISGATIVFQTIINNKIVTPSLLGMSSLYSLIHTTMIFVSGTGSILVIHRNLSFVLDLLIMGFVAIAIYSYLFKITKYNIS